MSFQSCERNAGGNIGGEEDIFVEQREPWMKK